MGKAKGEKSNPVTLRNSKYCKLSLYKWKLFELFTLGYRIDQCSVALEDYTNVPRTYETVNMNLMNFGQIWESFTPEHNIHLDIDNAIAIKGLENSWDRIKKRKFVDELNLTTNEKVFDYIDQRLQEINIYKKEFLDLLTDLCWDLSASGSNYDKMTDDEKDRFMLLEHILRSKACEALGYWSAKFETMKQNKENVKTRTTKKEERKAELIEWMKIMRAKEYRLKAMQKWGVSERTVLNYEQEIKAEKTAIMRKKDDPA